MEFNTDLFEEGAHGQNVSRTNALQMQNDRTNIFLGLLPFTVLSSSVLKSEEEKVINFSV